MGDCHPCDTPIPCDYFDGVYDYINKMLMEEDDSEFQDCLALQATEKYLSDALGEKQFSNFITPPSFDLPQTIIDNANDESTNNESSANKDSERKKNHGQDNDESVQGRISKQLASCNQDFEQTEKYDEVLLCPKMNPGFYNESPACHCKESVENEGKNTKQYRKPPESKRGRPRRSKVSGGAIKEVIDLTSLLTRCAHAMADCNTSSANELLKNIWKHSTPYGNATERLAYCYANALEARLAGTGSALYNALLSRRIPPAELLKAYKTYLAACPFKRVSNIFANKSIGKLTKEVTRIHIIDFGIMYGFQWPCLIQGISLRPGGSPMLRITGIDFPQPGFKPAEKVEQTGHHLISYCKRFNVPFEYNGIAKKWDTISVEDLKIKRDEMVVVNCLYRLRHMPDESAGLDSPRDAVLNLIRKIYPDLFVHGIVNGTYDASFFATRFREALHHYSSLFDMLDGTIPREDQDRLLYEREEFGRDVMNVIACEGPERIERPETYKKWQVRNQRAGFRQLPLNQDIVKEVKAKVKKGYHDDFLLDEDGDWMLQGWKGRVMHALSCWVPA